MLALYCRAIYLELCSKCIKGAVGRWGCACIVPVSGKSWGTWVRMNSTTMDWTRTSMKAAVPLKPDASMSLDLQGNQRMTTGLASQPIKVQFKIQSCHLSERVINGMLLISVLRVCKKTRTDCTLRLRVTDPSLLLILFHSNRLEWERYWRS